MEQRDIGEPVITATYEQYEVLLASLAWRDIKAEVSIWLDMINHALGSQDDPRDLYRMQGRKNACEEFLELPQALMNVLEERYKKIAETDIRE